MTEPRTLAQQAADKRAGNVVRNVNDPAYPAYPTDPRGVTTGRNPDGSPYSADRAGSVQIPDRGATGDTTTAIPTTLKLDGEGNAVLANGETIVTNPDGTRTVTHTDRSVTHYDANGNAFRSSDIAKQVAIDTAREKAYPTNPRFPGEGNPDFKG